MANNGLLSNHTIIQNVTLPLLYHRLCSRLQAHELAVETLQSVGYAKPLNILPSALNSFEQRLVALARALITKPQALFIEEAFTPFDVIENQNFIRLYRKLINDASLKYCVLGTSNSQIAKICAEQFIFVTDRRILSFHNDTDLDNCDDEFIRGFLNVAQRPESQ